MSLEFLSQLPLKKSLLLPALSLAILAGCSSAPKNRYALDNDVAPEQPLSVMHIENAHPRYEPYSLQGNRDYTLRGADYQIVKDTVGFSQTGRASWYGKKFHGHLTSNGEVYDMYSMSAAHKTLPLPSYVKVTNTDNGKTAIVRINDRGPFHDGRIIDLSYAAAYKLGVYQTGTAAVKIEVINVAPTEQDHNAKSALNYMIQVVAISDKQKARTLAQTLGQSYSSAHSIDDSNGVNRIMLGPFDNQIKAQQVLTQLQTAGYQSAFIKQTKHQTQH